MDNFIKSRRLYMLFVLPFLVATISFLSGRLSPTFIEDGSINGPISLDFINQWSSFWLYIVCFSIVLCVAYIIFLTNERFKLLHQTTTLPSLIYVLLTSGVILKLGTDNLLIAMLILTLAVDRFQVAINDIRSNKILFDFGFFLALSVVIYPKFLPLIIWALCVSIFSGRSTLKDLLALLYGLLLPIIFLLFYYFWTDGIWKGIEMFVHNLFIGKYIHELSTVELVQLGILSLILLVSLYQIFIRFSIIVINRRRGLLTFMSMLFFLIVSLLIIPINYYDFLYIIALPLSIIYSQFFLSNRKVVFGNIMFVLLLGTCFFTYFLNFLEST